ncbi:nuclear pore complex protein Nup155 isoform X2 [Lepeophtheirus salmonis]|uniref:nuclear pore complex protein Nup155 isoform X2 n=1 Tax=Lepeophtheirus salmonis TaxID=72036 RepID=UPI003AF3C1A5
MWWTGAVVLTAGAGALVLGAAHPTSVTIVKCESRSPNLDSQLESLGDSYLLAFLIPLHINMLVGGGSSTMLDGGRNLFDGIELAGRNVEKMLGGDSTFPSLVDKLRLGGGGPTLSGLQESDYPWLRGPGGTSSFGESLRELSSVKNVSLPAELVEHFGHMQCNCMMGLFASIGRAWLTIDSDIYVWKFHDCSDLAYFDGLSDTILSVALVSPKPNIFQPHIKHLLCLTTAVEIVLLGVSFSSPQESETEEMHLLPEPLYTLPTDSTYMITLVGTDLGRIFMGGKDGCLYEFSYTSDSSWFGGGKKVSKINHSTSALSFLLPNFINFSGEDPLIQIQVDDSRKMLYSRSEKGVIQVYDLGSDGFQMRNVATLSQHSIVQDAVKIASNIDKSNFHPIVDISPLFILESPHIALVAVSKSGVRFYFSVGTSRPDDRPTHCILQHVRLPPGFSASGTLHKPNKVHMSYHKNGSLLLACSPNENSDDVLFLLSSDGYPFQSLLMESQSIIQLDGHSWALSEIPQETSISKMYQNSFGNVYPPLMAVQHGVKPRKFVVLNAKGTHIISQMRPVDHLKQLLIDHGEDSDIVKAFFSLHGETQASATALILACSTESVVNMRVSDMAVRSFFLFGGEPRFVFSQQSQPSQVNQGQPHHQFHPHIVSTPMRPNLPPQSPQSPQQQQFGSPVMPEIQYSGKHNGLYLYFSRIIRPVWLNAVAIKEKDSNYLKALLESNELDWIIHQLRCLNNFLEKNATTHAERSGINGMGYTTTHHHPHHHQLTSLQHKTQQDAFLRERQSLMCLQQLIVHSIQVLGLMKVVCDHQFNEVVSVLNQDECNMLKSILYRDLIVTPHGKELCNRLVQAIISRYLKDNASTDAISNRLREVCPILYNNEDALSSKAHEILIAAKAQTNLIQREKMLKESLSLCKDIAAKLNLEVIVSHFTAVHYFQGAVEVCLAAAAKRDPQGLALHYYKNNEPNEDDQGLEAFMTRMSCYGYITEMLRKLLDTGSILPGNVPGVPRSPGPLPPPDPNQIPPEEASVYAEKVLQTCLKSDDQFFHAALYQWLVDEKHYERLLEIQSPYLEDFLKRGTSHHPGTLLMFDLLWKHYEKTQSYAAAAKILSKLAERHSTEVTLKERLEYLSRAIMCVKSGEMGSETNAAGELLHDLEEKMEVARVQLQILDALNTHGGHEVSSAVSRLNSDLLDISTLYQDFAEPYELWECQLSVLHCAGHPDQMLIETLWEHIINAETRNEGGGPINPYLAKTKIAGLSTKIKTLGRIYASSQKYFPLEYIIKKLESYSCIAKEDYCWVFNSMLSIGVSMPKILEIYNKLCLSNDPIWFKNGSPNHLLVVLANILNTFAESPSSVSYHERRSFVVTCQDAVVSYLGQLYTKPDSASAALIKELKCIQAKLERL